MLGYRICFEIGQEYATNMVYPYIHKKGKSTVLGVLGIHGKLMQSPFTPCHRFFTRFQSGSSGDRNLDQKWKVNHFGRSWYPWKAHAKPFHTLPSLFYEISIWIIRRSQSRPKKESQPFRTFLASMECLCKAAPLNGTTSLAHLIIPLEHTKPLANETAL